MISGLLYLPIRKHSPLSTLFFDLKSFGSVIVFISSPQSLENQFRVFYEKEKASGMK